MPRDRSAAEVADRIIGRGGTDAAALAEVQVVFTALENAMSAVLGEAGYQALSSRCIRKSAVRFPLLGAVVPTGARPHLAPLFVRLQTESAATIRAVGVEIFTQLLELLATLIGGDLTMKLLRRAWPDTLEQDAERAEKS